MHPVNYAQNKLIQMLDATASSKLQLNFHLITSCIVGLSHKTLFSFYAKFIVDGFHFLSVRIYSSPAFPYHLTRIVCSSITFICSMSALYSLDRNPLYLLRLALYSFPPAFISLPISLAKLSSAIDAPQNNCLHFGAPAGNFIWMRWDFPEGAARSSLNFQYFFFQRVKLYKLIWERQLYSCWARMGQRGMGRGTALWLRLMLSPFRGPRINYAQVSAGNVANTCYVMTFVGRGRGMQGGAGCGRVRWRWGRGTLSSASRCWTTFWFDSANCWQAMGICMQQLHSNRETEREQ